MNKILLIIPFLIGGITIAQARACISNSDCQFPNDLCAPIHQGVTPSNPPPKHCTNQADEDAYTNGRNFVPGLGGGNNQNTNGNNGNTNQNSQTGARPCGRLDSLLHSWGVRSPVTPPAGRPTMPTPPPTRAQSFWQNVLGFASNIVAGDNVQCSYLPKSSDGKELYNCTQAEELRINRNAGVSSRAARERILKECEGSSGISRSTLQPTEKICP